MCSPRTNCGSGIARSVYTISSYNVFPRAMLVYFDDRVVKTLCHKPPPCGFESDSSLCLCDLFPGQTSTQSQHVQCVTGAN